jgi:enoyl-CoA hydratase/carnithine racemase
MQVQEQPTHLHLTLAQPPDATTLAELAHLLENWKPPETLRLLILHLALGTPPNSSPQGPGEPSSSKHLPDTRQGRVRERAQSVAQERVLRALHHVSVPVLGVAAGTIPPLGCVLLSACDLLLAAEQAVFCTIGSTTSSASALAYRASAPRLGTTAAPAERLSAQHAARLALVTWLAPHERLEAEIERIARLLEAQPAHMLALTKRALLLGLAHPNDPAQALADIQALEQSSTPTQDRGSNNTHAQ